MRSGLGSGPEIRGRVFPALRFVEDVAHSQPHRPARHERVRIPGGDAAHLAGVAIALEHPGPRLLGDAALEGGEPLGIREQILAGLQIGAVLMRKDLPPFLVAQFPHPPRPFHGASARGLNVLRFEHRADVGEEVSEDQLFRACW